MGQQGLADGDIPEMDMSFGWSEDRISIMHPGPMSRERPGKFISQCFSPCQYSQCLNIAPCLATILPAVLYTLYFPIIFTHSLFGVSVYTYRVLLIYQETFNSFSLIRNLIDFNTTFLFFCLCAIITKIHSPNTKIYKR